MESKEVVGLSPRVREESANESTSVPKLGEFLSGSGHELFARPDTTDVETFEFVVERNEYNLPDRFNQDDIVIDIGAHIGSFSYAALERGAGKVYAYEAYRENHLIAKKNLARFGARVSCRQQAVWRSDQPSQMLYASDLAGVRNTGGVSVLYNNEGEPVETISLDEILFTASDGLRRPIRLLKIDVEGCEYPILFASNQLQIVQEICGEYHEVAPEVVPERAKVTGKPEHFDRFGLKDFFEGLGWSIVLEPTSDHLGLFHARSNSHLLSPADEFKVAEFMSEVREAVRLREANGATSFINASTALFRRLSEEGFLVEPISEFDSVSAHWSTPGELAALRLHPEFQPSADDRYHVNDLLRYHDREFVWNAYRAILKRDPDETGLRAFLNKLRDGSRNKIDILASLRFSQEGKRVNVSIAGLAIPAFIRKFYRVPVVGYLIETAVVIARLPKLVRSQRQLESHLVAQQDRLARSITQINRVLLSKNDKLSENVESDAASIRADLVSLRESLLKLSKLQKQSVNLQQQQVGAVFRDQQPLPLKAQTADRNLEPGNSRTTDSEDKS